MKKKIQDILWWLLLIFAIIVMFWTGRQVYQYLKETDASKSVNQHLIDQAVSMRPPKGSGSIGFEEMEDAPEGSGSGAGDSKTSGDEADQKDTDITLDDAYGESEDLSIPENGTDRYSTIPEGVLAGNGSQTGTADPNGAGQSSPTTPDNKLNHDIVNAAIAGNSWLTVNFDWLMKENSDIVGWLYCPGTPINYPVVHAENNEKYLRRLVNGEYNTAGTLFLDCRNWGDFSDLNSVIHGHHMKNDTMFGTLSDYSKQSYYEKHPVWQLLTPDADYMVELIAGYVTNDHSDVYTFGIDQDEKQALIENSLRASDFVTGAEWDAGDRFVTFSTCSYEYDEARYVVIGVLREED